jgi:uncharacterized damage-inducible protein DinB
LVDNTRVSALASAVERMARACAGFSEADLAREWVWRAHDEEGRRFALLVTYQELRELAARTAAARAGTVTLAQRALGQHQVAYRELHGLLVGLSDDVLDREPAPNEWPVRRVLHHIAHVERAFFAVADHALAHFRRGEPPTELARERHREWGESSPAGSLDQILGRYAETHDRMVERLGHASDRELTAPSVWWEGYPVEVGFRLFRFDAHLRQHTIQVEKTLDAIGQPPTEARRLIRLLYAALGAAEGDAIGGTATLAGERAQLAAAIEARTAEIA